MARFLAILSLLFIATVTFAEEQTSKLEDNKSVISIQKQPTTKQSAQKQDVKRNWFCIIIQVNGKIQENKTQG